MRTFYWIVAAGNIKVVDDVPILNAETMHVCDMAVHLFQEADTEDRIVCSAGTNGMNVTTLGKLMAEYLKRSKISTDSIVTLNAKTFNTVGEARAFADFVRRRQTPDGDDRLCVTIVVRWWHALRAWVLLRRALKRAGVDQDRVDLDIQLVMSWDIFGMFRECFAWPLTLLRMIARNS